MAFPKSWTPEQEQFLRDNHKKMAHQQMATALGKTVTAVHSKCGVLGLTLNKAELLERRTAYARIANNKRRLTESEDNYVKDNYLALSIHEIGRRLGRAKSAVKCSMTRQGLFLTDEIRYQRAANCLGKPSFNKGRKQSDYMTPEAIARTEGTRFKKGERNHNAKTVGTEIEITGYIKIKIAEPNKWKYKQIWVYEQHFGTIEKGSIVIFKDGNNRNFDIDNLENIKRSDHIRSEKVSAKWTENVKNLSDEYVADVLKRRTGLDRADIPKPLVELKRVELNLIREIKKYKKNGN